MRVAVTLLLCLLTTAQAGTWSAQRRIAALCPEWQGFDRNQDGEAEITALASLGSSLAQPSQRSGDGYRGLMLVLVEPRLVDPLRGELSAWLGDLAAEGLDAVALSVGVYAGPRHQDGQTVLALRDWLRAVHATAPMLRGVVLVGAFPDAFLVRQYAWWWDKRPITLNKGKPGEVVFREPIDIMRSVPEPVAMRCDLVLGDLDGCWEDVYHQGAEQVPYQILAYPQGRARYAEGAAGVEEGTLEFVDFFLSHDDPLRLTRTAGGKPLHEVVSEGNAECSNEDLKLPNPMARPELWVGRLDARHAAVSPDPAVKDSQGRGLLDELGRPQTLEFADEKAVPHPHHIWVADEATELRLLREWLDRRHRWRLGEYADARRPASIGTGWGSAVKDMRSAFPEWAGFAEPGYDVLREDVNLLEVVRWLGLPATARAMKAHGDPWGCTWEPAPDAEALEAAVGPLIFNWRRAGKRLEPSLGRTPGKLDFAVTRSLWANGRAPAAPALWLYTSCEGTMPEGATDQPYTAPRYGFWQGSECLLFHLSGLGLIGRSKVFYDEPRDMWPTLAGGGTLGDVWQHYFEVEAAEPKMRADNGIGCKRAYFWNTLGDPSVRLVPAPRSPERQDPSLSTALR